MAPPTRFNSVRGASRPLPHRSSFRDDTSLVALRYEKTVAAEPPVHVAPRQTSGNSAYTTTDLATPSSTTAALSMRRQPLHRSPSSSTTTSSSSYFYSASVSAVSTAGTTPSSIRRRTSTTTARGPVIVTPPPRLTALPVFAPPTEQHPALRSPLPCLEEWKRDSGVSPSPPPIHKEKRTPRLAVKSSRSSSADEYDCFLDKSNSPNSHAAMSVSHVEHIPARPQRRLALDQLQQSYHHHSLAGPTLTTGTISSSTGGTCIGFSATAGTGTGTGTGAGTRTTPPPTVAANHSDTSAGNSASTTVGASATLSLATSDGAALFSATRPLLIHHPIAAAVTPSTASDFLPAPNSPPPSPPRCHLPKRQSLRFPIWGGHRDDPLQQRQRQRQHQPIRNTHHYCPSLADADTGRRWNSLGSQEQPRSATPASVKHQPHDLPPPVSPAKRYLLSPSSPNMSSLSPSEQSRQDSATGPLPAFSPLGLSISTDNLLDEDFISSLVFSKRGSLMFDPDSVASLDGAMDRMSMTKTDHSATLTTDSCAGAVSRSASSTTSCHAATKNDAPRPSLSRVTSPTPDICLLTSQVEQESQKVRLLYASGDSPSSPARHSYCDRLEPTPEVAAEEEAEQEYDDDSVPYEKSFPTAAAAAAAAAPAAAAAANPVAPATTAAAAFSPSSDASSVPRSVASSSPSNPKNPKKELDPAGGYEDWDDLDSALVDRYGFIGPPRALSRLGTPTEMRSSRFSPRRRNVLTKRDPMGFTSTQSGRRLPSRKISARSLNTQHSEVSIVSFRSSRSVIRQAGNLLPQNRNRRWMDEAGDMLTVSPNLQDSVEEARVEKISQVLKRKEIDRSEKWRRMARVIRGSQGQGMEFDFDTKSPKLIERTWKGIPDRWRGAAWWSFLATSAKDHPGSATERDIIDSFHRLQNCASADDIQIDLDVPRTISRHVMFRRRYRGGQRLLFRVLHALSLYFAETGYVQGMASLAATLLCYFDEEKCFVMLVRMWQLRGLEQLYQPGFEGLMTALREFETTWLNKDVARKMTEICIDSTAYGTRWYLTLFNLSIPFPAQLRVWDVFLLLGGPTNGELYLGDLTAATSTAATTTTRSDGKDNTRQKLGNPTSPVETCPSASAKQSRRTTLWSSTPVVPGTTGLDVLHATSAALIQALREVLLDSDFENAMKALTAWIPIKDEDLLMKVTKAEWKTQLKRRG